MKTYKLLILSILSGFILHLAWTNWCPGYVIFIGFIPLLMVEQDISQNKVSALKMYKYSIIAFLTWNILSTWWIFNASFAGMLVAFIVNTFLFSGVFQLFHLFKKRTNPLTGYFGLIVFWMAFEYFYLNAEISWTWLNLGNAFAKNIKAIQWYEYTGTLGGTLWILLINLLLFNILNLIKRHTPKPLIWKNTVLTLIIILIPITISMVIFNRYTEKSNPVNVVVIQPNIDPYEKFVSLSNMEQTIDLLNIAGSYVDENTDYVVCPETAVTSYSNISSLDTNDLYVKNIRRFLVQYPKMKFIVGFTLRKNYKPGEKISETAQKYHNSAYFYDTYNSALQIDSSRHVQYYHKSQLVVGVEKMPYPGLLKFLEKIMLKLGGTFRSHGIQKERNNLISPDGKMSIAPVICWENVFGEYVTDFTKKGAQLIFVITNEGWWGNTQSHRQLNHLSQIRAIENRRSIVRSANTGTSSIINQKGELITTLGWWKKGALKGTINANDRLTFYVLHGDYLGKTSMFFSLLCLLYFIVSIFTLPKKVKS